MLIIGIAFSTINNQNLNKTIDIFNHTSSYSPLRIPKIFVQESECRQILSLFEDISLKTNIPYMKKVTNESHEINESFDFKLNPKLEIIFYYQDQDQKEPSNFKLPFSNTNFRIENIQQSIRKKDFEGEFFILTSDKEEYEGYIKEFSKKYNEIFQSTHGIERFDDFNNERNYSPIGNTDLYQSSFYIQVGLLFFIAVLGSYYLIAIREIGLLSNYSFSVKHIVHMLLGNKMLLFLLGVVVCELVMMWIKDYPFIEVLTLMNSTFWERNIIDGDSTPPLKVKTNQKNREKILNLVEANQLSDNLQLLHPYTRAEEIVVKMTSRSLGQVVSIFLVTASSFFSLNFFVLSILFIYNKRIIA